MAVKKTRTPTTRSQKIDFMKATHNIGKPIAAVAGFAVGKYALKKFTQSPTVSGLLGADMKDYIIPAAVTMGGLVGTQLTKNEYVKIGLVGLAGAGVEATIKRATGKTILQGLEGLIGDDESPDMELQALNPVTQQLPAADIDIEREIQQSMTGIPDYSMSDEPVGNTAEDFSMSDEPVGYVTDDDIEDAEVIGEIKNIDPDSMDFDIFSGDMMES